MVERRTSDGAVLANHRVSRAIEPVMAADRAAHRNWLLEGETGPRREMLEKLADEMPYPETKPPTGASRPIRTAAPGLKEYPPPGAAEGSVLIRLDRASVPAPPSGSRPGIAPSRSGTVSPTAFGAMIRMSSTMYVYGVDSIEAGGGR